MWISHMVLPSLFQLGQVIRKVIRRVSTPTPEAQGSDGRLTPPLLGDGSEVGTTTPSDCCWRKAALGSLGVSLRSRTSSCSPHRELLDPWRRSGVQVVVAVQTRAALRDLLLPALLGRRCMFAVLVRGWVSVVLSK